MWPPRAMRGCVHPSRCGFSPVSNTRLRSAMNCARRCSGRRRCLSATLWRRPPGRWWASSSDAAGLPGSSGRGAQVYGADCAGIPALAPPAEP
jgi:hypothetical protein